MDALTFTKIKTRDMKNKVVIAHFNVRVPMESLAKFGEQLKGTSGAAHVIVLPKGVRINTVSEFKALGQLHALRKAVDKEIARFK